MSRLVADAEAALQVHVSLPQSRQEQLQSTYETASLVSRLQEGRLQSAQSCLDVYFAEATRWGCSSY